MFFFNLLNINFSVMHRKIYVCTMNMNLFVSLSFGYQTQIRDAMVLRHEVQGTLCGIAKCDVFSLTVNLNSN